MSQVAVGRAAEDRALPLRERKKLRTRRALADAALRLFAEQGYDATTIDELADAAEVSKSTFFRFFPAKEAAAIEAEAELWVTCLSDLADRTPAAKRTVLAGLHDTLVAAVTSLDSSWDERFLATRRLIAREPALLAYVQHYRATVQGEIARCLAGKLGLDPDDLRLHILAELAVATWSIAGRHWVRNGGQGGRKALIKRFDDTINAIPDSLSLAEGALGPKPQIRTACWSP
jgi:AcrR family transcriptional regulator